MSDCDGPLSAGEQRPDGGVGRSSGSTAGKEGVVTERTVRREQEEREFIPVILKRTDAALRHPDDILGAAISEGLEQLCRPTLSLGLSAVAAGLILGFTAMSVAVVTASVGELGEMSILERLLVGLVYPGGFVVCLMSGAELFTEHTATAVYPVLDRRAGVGRLLRLWLVVTAGNLVGAFLSAGLLTLADGVIGAGEGYVHLGRHLVSHDTVPLLASAVLAGWLMALGAWLILATPPDVSQIASIYIVTFLIGLGGLHHSIAGAVEIFAAALSSTEFTAAQVIRFLGLALVGNLVGGSLFVAVFNYAHIRQTRQA